MAERPKNQITIICEMCGKPFPVYPCRVEAGNPRSARYCSRPCANRGQARNRTPWAKGKTKATDPRLAAIGQKNSQFYADHPDHNRGAKHHHFGKPMNPKAAEKIRQISKGRKATPAMLKALKIGQAYFKGKTAITHPILAERAKKSGQTRQGRPNPAHAEWAKQFYKDHPEKHPNRILAQRGYETSLERAMRVALEASNLPFEVQFPLDSLWLDFAFPQQRLAVEVDGAHWHDATKDAARDARIIAMGWRVIHFSEKEITLHIKQCVCQIKHLLSS